MAGTWALNLFDRLHVGHQVLIDRLQDMPEPVAVVTGGELMGEELDFRPIIQPPEVRTRRLNEYLESINQRNKIDVRYLTSFHELLEIEGPTTFMMYQGPCCIELEAKGLELRQEKLALEDKLEFLKPVRAYDGEKLSSARIRLGEVDREGRKLRGTSEPPRRLEFDSRKQLKTPKGELYRRSEGVPERAVVKRIEQEAPPVVIAVGDVTSATLIDEGYQPQVCIVDGTTKRGRFEREFPSDREYLIYNPPAVIYPEAWSTIDTAIHDDRRAVITVDGEEDLLGFPAVLLAPDNAVMLYGQPDEGIVWVTIDSENQKLARQLLDEMPVIE
ncbi:DUF359 domain-containing protein [Candidatus Thorarchaeota archaeon]|nr:MAG: DUF359 domain-containing protein [Candidatus Thorarchaeota archaeon]